MGQESALLIELANTIKWRAARPYSACVPPTAGDVAWGIMRAGQQIGSMVERGTGSSDTSAGTSDATEDTDSSWEVTLLPATAYNYLAAQETLSGQWAVVPSGSPMLSDNTGVPTGTYIPTNTPLYRDQFEAVNHYNLGLTTLTPVVTSAALSALAYGRRDRELAHQDMVNTVSVARVALAIETIWNTAAMHPMLEGVTPESLDMVTEELSPITSQVTHVRYSDTPSAALATDLQLNNRDVTINEILAQACAIMTEPPVASVIPAGGAGPATDAAWSLAEGSYQPANVNAALPLGRDTFKQPDQELAERDNQIAAYAVTLANVLKNPFAYATRLYVEVGAGVSGAVGYEPEVYTMIAPSGTQRVFVSEPALPGRNQFVYDTVANTLQWCPPDWGYVHEPQLVGLSIPGIFAGQTIETLAEVPGNKDAYHWRQKAATISFGDPLITTVALVQDTAVNPAAAPAGFVQADGLGMSSPGTLTFPFGTTLQAGTSYQASFLVSANPAVTLAGGSAWTSSGTTLSVDSDAALLTPGTPVRYVANLALGTWQLAIEYGDLTGIGGQFGVDININGLDVLTAGQSLTAPPELDDEIQWATSTPIAFTANMSQQIVSISVQPSAGEFAIKSVTFTTQAYSKGYYSLVAQIVDAGNGNLPVPGIAPAYCSTFADLYEFGVIQFNFDVTQATTIFSPAVQLIWQYDPGSSGLESLYQLPIKFRQLDVASVQPRAPTADILGHQGWKTECIRRAEKAIQAAYRKYLLAAPESVFPMPVDFTLDGTAWDATSTNGWMRAMQNFDARLCEQQDPAYIYDGCQYAVASGSIVYNGVTYNSGQTFWGVPLAQSGQTVYFVPVPGGVSLFQVGALTKSHPGLLGKPALVPAGLSQDGTGGFIMATPAGSQLPTFAALQPWMIEAGLYVADFDTAVSSYVTLYVPPTPPPVLTVGAPVSFIPAIWVTNTGSTHDGLTVNPSVAAVGDGYLGTETNMSSESGGGDLFVASPPNDLDQPSTQIGQASDGVDYNVTLRVRGLVELRDYSADTGATTTLSVTGSDVTGLSTGSAVLLATSQTTSAGSGYAPSASQDEFGNLGPFTLTSRPAVAPIQGSLVLATPGSPLSVSTVPPNTYEQSAQDASDNKFRAAYSLSLTPPGSTNPTMIWLNPLPAGETDYPHLLHALDYTFTVTVPGGTVFNLQSHLSGIVNLVGGVVYPAGTISFKTGVTPAGEPVMFDGWVPPGGYPEYTSIVDSHDVTIGFNGHIYYPGRTIYFDSWATTWETFASGNPEYTFNGDIQTPAGLVQYDGAQFQGVILGGVASAYHNHTFAGAFLPYLALPPILPGQPSLWNAKQVVYVDVLRFAKVTGDGDLGPVITTQTPSDNGHYFAIGEEVDLGVTATNATSYQWFSYSPNAVYLGGYVPQDITPAPIGLITDPDGTVSNNGTGDNPTLSFDYIIEELLPEFAGQPGFGNDTSVETINHIPNSGAWDYYCIVTNANGTAISRAVRTLAGGPTFTNQPQSVSVPLGTTAVLSAATAYDNPVTFQWQVLDGSTWTNISGGGTPTIQGGLAWTSITAAAGSYRCIATGNDSITVTSGTAVVSSGLIVSITGQSSDGNSLASPATIPEGGQLTLWLSVESAVVSGGTLSYQWQFYPTATPDVATNLTGTGSSGTLYESANDGESYFAQKQILLSSIQPSQSGQYVCVVSTTVSGVTYSVNSNLFSITVTAEEELPVITVQPASTLLGGELSITATGSGTLEYQWYVDTSGVDFTGDFTTVYGATSNTFTPTVVGYYECWVTDDWSRANGTGTMSSVVTVDNYVPTITSFTPMTLSGGAQTAVAGGVYSPGQEIILAFAYSIAATGPGATGTDTGVIAITLGGSPVVTTSGVSMVAGSHSSFQVIDSSATSGDDGTYTLSITVGENTVTATTSISVVSEITPVINTLQVGYSMTTTDAMTQLSGTAVTVPLGAEEVWIGPSFTLANLTSSDSVALTITISKGSTVLYTDTSFSVPSSDWTGYSGNPATSVFDMWGDGDISGPIYSLLDVGAGTTSDGASFTDPGVALLGNRAALSTDSGVYSITIAVAGGGTATASITITVP